jgi:N-acetyl-anhydromuramyl-L-alanine amidase AmpD
MTNAEAFPLPDDFTDRRRFAVKAPGGFETHPRTWSDVRGITLHQTACVLGTRDERWDTLGAHFGVMRSGRVVWLHDLNKVVWHAQGWSQQCIGIEIDGLFPGDAEHNVWDNPQTSIHEQATPLLDVQVTATLQLIRWLYTEVQRNGGGLKVLGAHRQAYAERRDDPGAEIWQRIALPASSELGLNDGGPGFKIGTGRAIPHTWNATRTESY